MKNSGARADLDSTVAEIELTLVSIIQGVALSFLIDSAQHVIGQIVFWPYIASGLLVVLIFWSRSVLHIITVIRWPLEFGHNFLYVACALAESLFLTRLSNPRSWFGLSAIYAGIVWVLFLYDLRLIRARQSDSGGPGSNRLYELVTKDQWLNITFLIPGLFVLNAAAAACLHFRPDGFLANNGHAWLAVVQVVAFVGYLIYVLRFYRVLAPLIAQAREERISGE